MITLLLYVFHTDLWPEILPLISNIKDLVGIDIALYKHNDNTVIINDLKKFNLINIRYVDNHGVDISPFLHQVKDLNSSQYPYFIKLHSKKSVISKLKWRFVLFNALIGSRDILINNKDLLKNTTVGAITDKTMIMSSLGYNKQHIKILSNILQLNKNTKNKTFMAGSMFMSKTQIFQKYFNDNTVNTIDSLLEDGVVKDEYNGTFCHATERIFGKIIHNENLSIAHAKLSPYVKIYNHQFKKTFVLYKCYNDYCYNFDTKNRVFGQIYRTIQPQNSIFIDWEHLPYTNHYPKLYTQISNHQYVCMNY